MTQPHSDDVRARILVEYQGTMISTGVVIGGTETDAVKVNQALEYLTKKIQIMVQSEQGVSFDG